MGWGAAGDPGHPGEVVIPAAAGDWDTEFGDYIPGRQGGGRRDEAIHFIDAHGTGHSEAIVTADYFAAQRFLDEVDAAAVCATPPPASPTGLSSAWGRDRHLHPEDARPGPMGLEELTSSNTSCTARDRADNR